MVDRINPIPGDQSINRPADAGPATGVGQNRGAGAVETGQSEILERDDAGTRVAADSVSISSEAAFRIRALDAVRNAPDARLDRVEALREAIASGNYNVTSADLAARLLGRVDNG